MFKYELTHGPIVQLNQTLNTAKNAPFYCSTVCRDVLIPCKEKREIQGIQKKYNLRFNKLP